MPPLIVGAGPAGCAAALALRRHGIATEMIERDAETGDAICGGFMSWRTLESLGQLGMDVQGHAVSRVALFAGGRQTSAVLPGRAIGLSRRALDTAMQAAVAARVGPIERGIEVREIGTGAVRTSGGERRSDAIFLATGKHDVRGAGRPRDANDATLGLRRRIPAHSRLGALIGDAIELHLFDRCYVGLVLQEDGSANLCLAVRKSRLTEAGGRPAQLLAELAEGTPLGDRLAFDDSSPVDAIAAVPYGWRATTTQAGIWRLGDQAAVIPSLAGEGIGIAIASGIDAADAFAAGVNAPDWQQQFATRARRPVAIAKMLWHAAEHSRIAPLGIPLLATFPSLAGIAARATRIGH